MEKRASKKKTTLLKQTKAILNVLGGGRPLRNEQVLSLSIDFHRQFLCNMLFPRINALSWTRGKIASEPRRFHARRDSESTWDR